MIKDSGNRTEFESGAVRDIQKGKGRCDLLPLDVVSGLFKAPENEVFDLINLFVETGDYKYLEGALFVNKVFDDIPTMLLEVSVHFSEGCEKYGENNWKKGINLNSYINSGVRHYLKHLRGDDDERHDRAFCWNIMCAIWTCKHKPELNDYKKTQDIDKSE